MYSILLTAWAKAPANGVDFKGVDIRYSMLDNAEACQNTCNEDDQCQFYTYITENFHSLPYRYSIFCAESKQTNISYSETLVGFVP